MLLRKIQPRKACERRRRRGQECNVQILVGAMDKGLRSTYPTFFCKILLQDQILQGSSEVFFAHSCSQLATGDR